MNAQYLIEEIKQHGEIKMSEDMLHEFIEFQTPREVKTLESVSFAISGHKPLMEHKFDPDKFRRWCKENKFLHQFADNERMVYLKVSQY